MERIQMTPERMKDNLAYIDSNIEYWRKRPKSDPERDMHIEAFQRTRERYHGERLPIPDEPE